ncbi:conserved protein of unknown function (plasmid) [Rhodovastum atsumiense]|uniref:Uncharacterized protein n=1 Tax=Rhodovastum atsumiense TaxID=504468 RepID=A0A5M6IJ90_9PROT|nr:hypothetical protein [Rhodovastum atsumiense]KAA5607957.1 hypothetical protein F1189_31380 [Rhodovastum atsumiense]CAH2605949.1 conserved protein of unknown function [Rhodovastum atsumiense]
MFYTRPNIDPLNLDLVRLDGGGSCPSQFFGTTVDGRSLYIRYRNGWLSAEWDVPDCELSPGRKELVEAQIGPMFHGDILMEQVCDLLGLTFFGVTPPFTEEDRIKAADRSRILDWSGRTTYWEELLQVTKEGGTHFVKTLQAAFGDVTILEAGWRHSGHAYIERASVEECERQATIGINADRARLHSILNSEHARLSDLRDMFSHVIDFRFDWNSRSDRERYVNHKEFNSRFFEAFGNKSVLAERNFGIISGEFATNDPNSRDFVSRLYELIDACFSRQAAWVDPQGTLLRRLDRHSFHSRDLTEWCRRSPNHYISWGDEDFGNGKIIAGLRAL